jgi:hypothetical protein
MFNFNKSLVWLKAVSLFLLIFGLTMLNSITFADDELDLSVSTTLETIDQSSVSNGQVSECKPDVVEKNTSSKNENECIDETIAWQYDTELKTLSFTDENVWLNCCGEHTIVSFYDEETEIYEILETDDAINSERCRCMCFYDFKIDIPNIATENIQVKLTRAVDKNKITIWEGSLNLQNGQGVEPAHSNIEYCSSDPDPDPAPDPDPDPDPAPDSDPDPSQDSCANACGGQAPGGCHCDDLCVQYGDCCSDKVEECGSDIDPT